MWVEKGDGLVRLGLNLGPKVLLVWQCISSKSGAFVCYRLKCPYCPVEMTSDEPRQIYF